MTVRHLTILGIYCILGLIVCPAMTQNASAQDKNNPASVNAAKKQSAKVKVKEPGVAGKPSGPIPTNQFPGKFAAPGLDGGAAWLNTSGEITIKELRGKIVLLDFWTYCCINCMHILPDLAYLEKKFPNELVVIGVHSAKFFNEKDTDNIRRAILRYEIKHPVINDPNLTLWNKFSVSSWPTMVVIDPEGKVCGTLQGEGNRKNLEFAIERLIAYHKAKGTLDQTPLHFNLESEKKAEPTALRFPGKIVADEASRRLFISDSNHNRIVVADLEGKVLDVIGSGTIGRQDGSFAEAQFDHPQGMDFHGNVLYVADTENHSIRAIDFATKQVKTIAGNGKHGALRGIGGSALSTALSSPWDLKKIGSKLFIAMAGPHQIWVLDNNSIRPYAGSGREDVTNGALRSAALAQPSGITTDGTFLYVVDSEGSAVRKIPLDPSGKVTTIVGTSDLPQGRCLFEYGDIDGTGNQARLQHPLGIVFHKGLLYVADSYNHKIKIVDLEKKSIKTFLGTGKPGAKNDNVEFSEPAGLTFAGEKLYVADTNNHQIRVVDFQLKTVSNLELKGLEPPKPISASDSGSGTSPKELPAQTVASNGHLQFDISLQIPEGFKLNPAQDPIWQLKAEGEQTLVSKEQLNQRDELKPQQGLVSIKVPLAAKSGSGKFKLNFTYTICSQESQGGVCQLKLATWIIPVTVKEGASQKSIALEIE
ncbi:MAG: ykuV [Planctomycetaceae bacterium]|nr:ykuV [Planctomycetaceae bacterium]